MCQETSSPAPTGIVTSFRYALSSARQLRAEVFGGLVVALALIPEAIGFSIMTGVDPAVGLYTSAVMAIVIAFTGGRPALITGSTGAVSIVLAPLMHAHGFDYLVAAVLLGGILQILLAAVGAARLLRFLPRSVMVGFINMLGVFVFLAQIDHVVGVPWQVYPLVAVGIVTLLAWRRLPARLNTALPAPFVAVIVVTLLALAWRVDVPRVADMGELPRTLPTLFIPQVPWTLDTLRTIAPFSLTMAVVGLMESLLTAKLVDALTDVHSDKTRESYGQGLANCAAALCGGMGGCGMIGQTMINVRESGARTRLSTLLSGVFLLLLTLVLADAVGAIPMAALAAVLIMVSVDTVDWHSLSPRTLTFMPWSETLVMGVTMAATFFTRNLAVGVGLGVLVATVLFARRVAHLVRVTRDPNDDSVYRVSGQLFWASSNDLVYAFDYDAPHQRVTIDLSDAEIWDASTVATLDTVRRNFAKRGISATITGLRGPSAARLDKLSGRLREL